VNPEGDFVTFTFATTHDAIAAEALLLRAVLDVVPVPAPKTGKALCGLAMRLPAHQARSAEKVMIAGDVIYLERIEGAP